jgi:acyl-CoA thioesterase
MPENMNALIPLFENDHFAATCGIRLLELRPGFAKMVMEIDARHSNRVGTVHGGAIFALADSASGAASKTGGKATVSVNTTISFVKAAKSGTLYAEATEVARSRKLSTSSVRVIDDAGELIALFQGTAYIKEEPFPPVNA